MRLEEVAQVIDSVENTKVAAWFNGNQRAIMLAVQRQPGANTVETVDAIKRVLPTFQAQLPASIELQVLYDRSVSIREAIDDVQFTLVLAGVLVVLVILLFLRNLSATLIPSLALPISVVGTFAAMHALGYSLDNLSLLALTLSVGFVVDDAIVMLENIVRHIEAGEEPFEAAIKGSREIGFTIVSMTLSLMAVFIPVLFMGGIVGRLLHEFAVTICAAILVSGLVSLTLTPMLCSRYLRHDAPERARPGLPGLRALLRRPAGRLRTSSGLGHGPAALGAGLLRRHPGAHRRAVRQRAQGLPAQRRHAARSSPPPRAPQDVSFAAMVERQRAVAEILAKDPNVRTLSCRSSAPAARARRSIPASLIVNLKPRGERH